MKRRTLACAFLTAVAGISASVHAQKLPPLETGPKLVEAKMLPDGQVEMRDAKSGALLIAPRGATLWDNKFDGTAIKPEITFQVQPSGFDLLYTFTNTASVAKPPAMLRLGILTLGPEVTYQDFRYGSEDVHAHVATHKSKALTYPKQLYSPVWVLKNQTHAMGVSIQYPIMDYKHDVRFAFSSPGGKLAEGEGGRGWLVEQRLANVGNESANTELGHSASIAPGTSQAYVVSVRVASPEEWVRTLVPYRDYFQSLYGGVKYTRDPRPIRASAVASFMHLSPSNPMGLGNEKLRPDTNGWGPWTKRLKTPKGWAGVILWDPSGLYYHNRDNNYPFQFTTRWLDNPKTAEALDKNIGLPSVAAAGTPVGLWWGRSCQVADVWDDATLEPFNPDNAKHKALALAELDLAVQAGATIIGLDTFSHRHTPVWKLKPWLEEMQARHPQVRFGQEPICSDIMHTVAASFFRCYDDAQKPESVKAIMKAKSAHILADFINPGHEIWGGFRYAGHKQYFGIDPTAQMIIDDAKHLASCGFVPVMFTDFDMPAGILAAESWRFSIPSDLQRLPTIGKGGTGNGASGTSGAGGGQGGGNTARTGAGKQPPVGPFQPPPERRRPTKPDDSSAAAPPPARDTSDAKERAKIANADDGDR